MKSTTCCFTGHRRLPPAQVPYITKRLAEEVDKPINMGVTNFISGGALGFDQIAAALIIARRNMGAPVRLLMALPCREQDKFWPPEKQQLYHHLLAEADAIHYSEEKHSPLCLKKRNYYMVQESDYCVCALLHPYSGTWQTVAYARRRGLKIINVAI